MSLSLIIAVTFTIAIVLIALSCSLYIYLRRRRVAKRQARHEDLQENWRNQELLFYDCERRVKDLIGSDQFKEDDMKGIHVPFFNLESILAATDNFSDANKIGQGGFGSVYKVIVLFSVHSSNFMLSSFWLMMDNMMRLCSQGKFLRGQEIAVKRLLTKSAQGLEEFMNEVVLIAKLQHRNIVRLLGYCVEGDEKILLYEYMLNGSLDSFIFERTLCVLLDWKLRFNIILGIARGLLYLHQDFKLRIIHRDLKTSNILLDDEMNPKISDFGFVRLLRGKQTEESTNRIVGTYGYMSHEYAMHGHFSDKSDVFSFGVIVLEIISGKKNSSEFSLAEHTNIIGYAWRLWNEDKALDLMDQTLRETCNTNEFLKCVNVGLLCIQDDPSDRPTMSNVVFMLGSETATLPTPKQPAFIDRRGRASTALSSSSIPQSINDLTITVEEGR